MKAGKKICIVTPDLIGPINNGGIGTHCYNLAIELSDDNDVTILFTGPIEIGTVGEWVKFYKKINIKLECIKSNHSRGYFSNADWFLERSFLVHEYLRLQKFDFVHFQEWQANGFIALQSKRTTRLYEDTQFIVTMHSSNEWQNDGMKRWNKSPRVNAKLEWCERYVCENCDMLISPSQHMIDWAVKSHWKVKDNAKILPYCYIGNSLSESYLPDTSHLIFFGRLESRKGLELFCEGLIELRKSGVEFKKITFLGKDGEVQGDKGSIYIRDVLDLASYNYTIINDLDSFKAIEYIRKTKGVVVMPSILDNYPFTVLECIEQKIPFLCSDAGGIPEMVDFKVVFHADVSGFVQKLKLIDNIDFLNISHKYNSKKSSMLWKGIHDEKIKDERANNLKSPFVSICIPYYNYGKYLPNLLKSIESNDYCNYEVICVNDGSTSMDSIDVFTKLEKEYADKKWIFINKENSGIGMTRNLAAEKASGDYLIFMDSDNLARPNMISSFVEAIIKSNSDCVTCHFDAFDESTDPNINDFEGIFRYIPLGASVEAGVFENVFGDANFIIRRSVFNQLNGFGTQRKTSWEDYEFLARLCLKGYKLEVIPESLFLYRHTKFGFSRITNNYDNHNRVLDTYSLHYGYGIGKMFKSCVVPMYYEIERLNNIIGNMLLDNPKLVLDNYGSKMTLSYSAYLKLNRFIAIILPDGSKRRVLAKNIIKKIIS